MYAISKDIILEILIVVSSELREGNLLIINCFIDFVMVKYKNSVENLIFETDGYIF